MDTITVAPMSATSSSPKLVKKHSLVDIHQTGGDSVVYGCDHLKGLFENAPQEAVKRYSTLVNTIHQSHGISARIPKISSSAASVVLRPTYLCLQCPNVATSDQKDRHDKGHMFCVESGSGCLYCRECRDFVYDPKLEEVRQQQGKKRKYSTYLSDVDSKILAANSTPTPCRAAGLRGLYNMGQTCFMSVVLQSLIHNPFIRAYYLSEDHRPQECEREACTSCALDEIFTEFHSTEKAEGYGAVAMLQGSWRGGSSLAGYQQQDAHEYLQFILNSLHSATLDDGAREDKAEDCACMIHKTFCGLLQSTVTCAKCENVTMALDPFMDLSLDVRTSALAGLKKKKAGGAAGAAAAAALLPPPPPPLAPAASLSECLDRFTSAETLPPTEYTCRKCASSQSATKRLRLSRLPPVLPIHLKRFSHSKTAATSVKLDAKVRFPLCIDLSPYVARPRKKDGAGGPKVKEEKEAKDGGAAAAAAVVGKDAVAGSRPLYVLSSVIVHKGKMDSGHYVSYSRVGDEWFMFDDSKVVVVDEREVLASEAYMLFYVVGQIEAE